MTKRLLMHIQKLVSGNSFCRPTAARFSHVTQNPKSGKIFLRATSCPFKQRSWIWLLYYFPREEKEIHFLGNIMRHLTVYGDGAIAPIQRSFRTGWIALGLEWDWRSEGARLGRSDAMPLRVSSKNRPRKKKECGSTVQIPILPW